MCVCSSAAGLPLCMSIHRKCGAAWGTGSARLVTSSSMQFRVPRPSRPSFTPAASAPLHAPRVGAPQAENPNRAIDCLSRLNSQDYMATSCLPPTPHPCTCMHHEGGALRGQAGGPALHRIPCQAAMRQPPSPPTHSTHMRAHTPTHMHEWPPGAGAKQTTHDP